MFRSVLSNVLNSPEKVKIETLRILATSDRLGYVQNAQAHAPPRIANSAARNTVGPGEPRSRQDTGSTSVVFVKRLEARSVVPDPGRGSVPELGEEDV
jgi:hypothetical protein